MKKDRNKYPKGLTAAKAKAIIAHYDAQSDDDAIAEADAAFENSRVVLMRVPVEIADDVLDLIALANAKRENAGKPTQKWEAVKKELGIGEHRKPAKKKRKAA
jgi:hypothetical protein